MKELIIDWLKTKKNYSFYLVNKDSLSKYNERFSEMLFHSRIHFSDLSVSDCYIVENINDKIVLDYQNSTHYKHTFENFNSKINEYIYDKVFINEIIKNFTVYSTIQNKAMVLNIFSQLKHDYSRVNIFFEKRRNLSYKDFFFDVTKDNYLKLSHDLEDILSNNMFSSDDFKSTYIDRMKEENRGLKEIGVFYPFVINHNILNNDYYLFEVNQIRFKKRKNNFEKIISKFYEGYGVNSNKANNIFQLNYYFEHPGNNNYSEKFAYFNPFKHYEKYENDYKKIYRINQF